MRNNQQGFGFIGILVLLLIVSLFGFLTYTFVSRASPTKSQAFPSVPPLARGVYGPNVSGLTKYQQVPGLMDALKTIATNNPCSSNEGRFKQIILGVTSDKTQALIGNSCGSTGVLRTFMVKNGDKWTSVGTWKDEGTRTDFSALTDTPSCEVVGQYNIQTSIAPVCFDKKVGASDLFAGDMTSYAYRVRQ